MDALSEKSYLSYDNLSRYSTTPFYYNSNDKKYVMGITSWLKENAEYVLIKIKPTDTLTSLANTYYGRPDYYWIIADFNRIIDIFDNIYTKYNTLKIPTITQISFED